MKNFKTLYIFLVITVCIFIPQVLVAQEDPNTALFIPAITLVELSGREPVPSGIAAEMSFGGGAGGGGGEIINYLEIQWAYEMLDIITPGEVILLEACGYPLNEKPTGVLTYPSGIEVTIAQGEIELRDSCAYYMFSGSLNMELGSYSFTYQHPDRTLTHSWRVLYPHTPTVHHFSATENSVMIALMGFEPNQVVDVQFYALDSNTEMSRQGYVGHFGSFVAVRTIQMDAVGISVLELRLSRSAPFEPDYFRINASGYNVAYEGCPGGCMMGFHYWLLPNSLRSGVYAQVYVQDDGLNLRDEHRTSSDILEKLPSGTIVEIINGPETSDGYTWWFVLASSGNQGWVVEAADGITTLTPSQDYELYIQRDGYINGEG